MDKRTNTDLLSACNWEVYKTSKCYDLDCDCLNDFEGWRVAKIHPLGTGKYTDEQKNLVCRARHHLKQRKLCHLCGQKLVPIGYSRANGRIHKDWPNREYHKKCWLSVLQRPGHIIGGDETDTEE